MSHDDPNVNFPEAALADGGPLVQADASTMVLGVGDQLRKAREARGMTIANVSETIKISPRVIEQVEANAWSQMSGHTFARGVVRSYARLVHLNPEALLKELESAPLPKPPLLELQPTTNAALPVPGQTARRDKVTMVVGICLVALAIVVYFLIPDDWSISSLLNEPPSTQSSVVPAVPPVVVSVPVSAPVSPSADAAPQAVSSVVSITPPSSVLGAQADELKLSFSDGSWAEVRDRSGNVLLSENVAAGGNRTVTGQVPLSIWLGNADGVRMSFRGQPVDLVPHTRQRVARLNLE